MSTTDTNADTLETILVPLRKLMAWEGNVRRTRPDQSIHALAASIQSVGLLQSLVIRKATKGKYNVVAGKRRLLALSHLSVTGVLASDFPVPCRVVPKEADLTEVSLAENVGQEPMHPADEFEAFRSLLEHGHSAADIAARFGLSELTVQKRLALARVSPTLIEKYRAGEMTLELLQAFTISDDHQAQEQVWSQLQRWNRQPHTIRQMLAQDDLPASDKRVRFVGIAAYEAAGGTVKRDLFADDENGEGVYISNQALLQQLLQEKLANAAQNLQANGWKWVEIQPETDYQHLSSFRRIQAKPAPLPIEKQTELETLEREHAELAEDLDENAEEGEEDEERLARLDELDHCMNAIRKSQECDYAEEVKAAAGAVVSIGYDGTPQITYGLVRKEDEVTFSQDGGAAGPPKANSPSDEGEEKRGAYSAALLESLTAYKTAAIAAELAQNVHVALAGVVYTLASKEFALDLRLYGTKTCLQISHTRPNFQSASDSPAVAFLERQRSEWLAYLPGNPADLWAWCVAQTEQTLLQLLAFLSAATVNAIEAKHDIEAAGRIPHADAIAAELGFAMTRWFRPTAENFFDRIPKAKVLEALQEAGKEAGSIRHAMKKAELAKVAEYDLAETGWLPKPLCVSPDFQERLRGHVYDESLDEEEQFDREPEGDQ